MPTKFGETQHSFLTPTPQRQAAAAGVLLAGGAGAAILRNPRSMIRTWKFGASTITTLTELGGALPALGSSQKFGVRYGGAGVTTIGETFLGNMYMGGTPEANLPIPTFGFGITAVPNTSSRLVFEQNKSRPGEHTSRSGTPETGKSMPGASAQRKGRSRPSFKKPGRRIPLADRRGPATSRERRPRTVRYRKGGCPPGYRYDRRRRMCVLTN